MKSYLAGFSFLLASMPLGMQADEVQTEMIVPWLQVSTVGVDIHMREGNLILTAGTEDLLRSVFTHTQGQKRPHLTFAVDDNQAQIDLESRGRAEQWEVYLTEKVPLELELRMQTGNQRIDLNGLRVRKLDLDAHTGNMALDVGGEHKFLEEVQVAHHVGNVTLDFTGRYDQLKEIAVEGGVGEAHVNLSGAWLTPAHVEIDVESGNLSLVVPQSQGARVQVKNEIGEVVTKSGIQESGERQYVNKAYGNEGVSVEIEVEVHRGNVFIQES